VKGPLVYNPASTGITLQLIPRVHARERKSRSASCEINS
jgi:hypothetical protein